MATWEITQAFRREAPSKCRIAMFRRLSEEVGLRTREINRLPLPRIGSPGALTLDGNYRRKHVFWAIPEIVTWILALIVNKSQTHSARCGIHYVADSCNMELTHKKDAASRKPRTRCSTSCRPYTGWVARDCACCTDWKVSPKRLWT